jgi:hypothetical protein
MRLGVFLDERREDGSVNVHYRIFRATLCTWDELFEEAAAFASALGFEKVINISHSADGGNGTVVVWYWHAEGDPEPNATPG